MSGRQEVKFQAQGLFLKCSILKSLLAQKVFVPNCSQGARDFSVTSVLMENVGLWKQMKPVCSKGMLLGQELGLADARLCPVRTRSSVFRWYPQAFALSQLPCGASRDGQLEKSLPLTIHCTSNQASLFFFFPPLFSYSVCKKQHNDIQDKKKKYLFLCYCPIYFFLPISVEKQDTVIALKQNLGAIRFSLLYKFLQYLTASVAYSVFLKYSVR